MGILRIRLLPSAVSVPGEQRLQFLTSYLINDRLAIDAGSLGIASAWKSSARSSMWCCRMPTSITWRRSPFSWKTRRNLPRTRVTIHGSEAVLDGLRRHVFNGCLWPDLIHASLNGQPFFHLAALEPGRTVEIAGVRITPVPVSHVVPAMGFLLEEGDAAVVLPVDTGPTEDLWRRANLLPKVDAVFLEATFPNSMDDLARIAKHLTPKLFAEEVRKLRHPAKIIAIHIKASFYDQIVEELQASHLPNLQIGMPGVEYCF